jgi:hypothetical protein
LLSQADISFRLNDATGRFFSLELFALRGETAWHQLLNRSARHFAGFISLFGFVACAAVFSAGKMDEINSFKGREPPREKTLARSGQESKGNVSGTVREQKGKIP